MIYNILDFGAKTSDFLQTEKIQKAIDTCFLNGGGEVVIPTGVFKTGGLRLRSNVTLHLLSGAVLEGSENPEDYCGYINDTVEPLDVFKQGDLSRSVYHFSRWNNAIIRAIYAENIAIIGEPGSYIDGMNCYDELGEENFRGPHGINFRECKNITLNGYAIRRSANWAHNIFKSQNIEIKNVSVFGGHDGIDIFACDNVVIENCELYTGDDCVAGFDNQNVTVKDCRMNCACNAIRFGGTDVLIENCKIWSLSEFGHRWGLSDEDKKLKNPTNDKCNRHMLSAFCYYCDSRINVRKTPGNILMKNCEIKKVHTLFDNKFGERWTCNCELESFKMENCNADEIDTAIEQRGENGKTVIEFENVGISFSDDADKPCATVENFGKIIFKKKEKKNCNNPTIIKKSEIGEIMFDNTSSITVKDGE